MLLIFAFLCGEYARQDVTLRRVPAFRESLQPSKIDFLFLYFPCSLLDPILVRPRPLHAAAHPQPPDLQILPRSRAQPGEGREVLGARPAALGAARQRPRHRPVGPEADRERAGAARDLPAGKVRGALRGQCQDRVSGLFCRFFCPASIHFLGNLQRFIRKITLIRFGQAGDERKMSVVQLVF